MAEQTRALAQPIQVFLAGRTMPGKKREKHETLFALAALTQGARCGPDFFRK
jgi:hypothetical protein